MPCAGEWMRGKGEGRGEGLLTRAGKERRRAARLSPQATPRCARTRFRRRATGQPPALRLRFDTQLIAGQAGWTCSDQTSHIRRLHARTCSLLLLIVDCLRVPSRQHRQLHVLHARPLQHIRPLTQQVLRRRLLGADAAAVLRHCRGGGGGGGGGQGAGGGGGEGEGRTVRPGPVRRGCSCCARHPALAHSPRRAATSPEMGLRMGMGRWWGRGQVGGAGRDGVGVEAGKGPPVAGLPASWPCATGARSSLPQDAPAATSPTSRPALNVGWGEQDLVLACLRPWPAPRAHDIL